MRFDIVMNPASASGKAEKVFERIRPVFESSGHEYTLHVSDRENSIGSICARICRRAGEKRIVIIGGDGTLNEAVNGMSDFEHTLVGLVPCGTGNDLVRDLDLPKGPVSIAKLIVQGSVRHTSDIGEIAAVIDGQIVTRSFVISTDIGFGAATCEYVSKSKIKPLLNKAGLGKLCYLIEAVRVCFREKTADVRVTSDEDTAVYMGCICAMVMNHRFEGGGFNFAPSADPNDGQFDLCISSGLSKPQFMFILPTAYLGMHTGFRGIATRRARELRLDATRPVYLHTDGEVLGRTRAVRIRLSAHKLRLMM